MLHFDRDDLDDDEFLAFHRIETTAAMLTNDDLALYDPPDEVWDGIVARIVKERAGHSDSSWPPSSLVAEKRPTVVAFDPMRREARGTQSWIAPLAAAAALLLVVGVIWNVSSGSGVDVTELASAPLGEISGSGAGADARLVRASDGLHVELSNATMPAAPAGFYYEIWLVDPDVSDPRSLSAGAMGDRTDFTVPEGVDPERYPIIDVSLEPDDGNPAHSGTQNSVARGVLEL